nr:hypothetical protein [Pseudomonadota bacterium]
MTQKNLNRMQEAFELIEPTVRIKKRPRNNWEEIAFPNFVPPWTETVAHYTIDYTDSPPKEITGKAGEAMP